MTAVLVERISLVVIATGTVMMTTGVIQVLVQWLRQPAVTAEPELRDRIRQWQGTPAPCGISYADIYSPCLPERDQRGLWCATCGLRQRLALEAQ